MVKVHKFSEKLAQEKVQSAKLDQHFGEAYHILPAPLELDKKGVDRIFVEKGTLEPMTIEYKHDFRASETGNAFIETCSVHKEECEKLGWAFTCGAEFLMYHVVGDTTIYILDTATSQQNVDGWSKLHREAKSFNPTYHSIGILVPLSEIKGMASAVEKLKI
jgi:hypothetical protein